jgi:AcrR family transcriptional regulator
MLSFIGQTRAMTRAAPADPTAGPSAPRTARERVRVELTREIREVARRQLAAEGAPALSLRAVARELKMASSAVYRYYPSRDALLTDLIVEAYRDLGEAAAAAEHRVRRGDHLGRWRAICRGARSWALAHPHEYALIYGSPVPGYAAPQDTVVPAGLVPALLIGLLADFVASGAYAPAAVEPVPAKVRAALGGVLELAPPGFPVDLVVRGVMAWTYLFGAISSELFGHRYLGVLDYDTFFDEEIRRMGAFVGVS